MIGLSITFQSQSADSTKTVPSITSDASHAVQKPGQPDESASALVKATVQNELNAIDNDHTHWMYEVETHKGGITERKEVIETPHGNLSRVTARNGQPLNPDEQKQEDEKVQKFVSDTAAQQKQRRDLDRDSKKTRELLAMLPDALIYTPVSKEGNRAKLTFKPNPSFHPPSCEAKMFAAMQGEMVIDTKEHRLIEFSGHLTQPVKFGGGLLGDLNAGGTFDVRQQEVGSGHWDILLLKVNVKGKALFLKTIAVQQDEEHTNFKRVSDALTPAQADDMAKKQEQQPS